MDNGFLLKIDFARIFEKISSKKSKQKIKKYYFSEEQAVEKGNERNKYKLPTRKTIPPERTILWINYTMLGIVALRNMLKK
jgi:hypothetical protein